MNRLTLKDCCSFQEGYVNPSQKHRDYFDGKYKWLRASDLNDGVVYNTERTLSEKGFLSAGKSSFLFKENTLAISKSGTIGRLGILKDKMCGNRAVINIDVNQQKADLYYVFYTLKYKKEEILSKAGGSIQKNLYVSALETISLNHQDVSTQKAIASVLSSLDTKIELNNRINAELEAMAKTLYDYWFVQFDFPNQQGKPYKSSGGKMVYNKELKREIPEGWADGTLADLGTIIGGSTPSKAKAENFCQGVGTPWITPKDLSLNKGNKFITRGEFDATVTGIKDASLTIMPKGTILLSSRAPIGYLAISREKVTTNQGFKSFIPNKGYSSEFVYYAVKNMIPSIEQNGVGSTFKEVSASTLKTIKISLPSRELLETYNSKAVSIFKKQDLLELENQQLASLRDWLLPMLMNGQVTVKEAEEKLVELDSSTEQRRSMAAEPETEYKTNGL
ncbi:Type I restriction modification DNA specificity domain protein [anaerobic digester metagenome]